MSKWWPSLLAIVVTLCAAASIVRVAPLPLASQPGPDAQEYADSAQRMAHDEGFVTYAHGPVAQPPRYPPGFPLMLSPLGSVGKYPSNIQRGATAVALLYLLAMVLAGWLVAGPFAATIAGAVVWASPFVHDSASFLMSDALVGALTVLMVPLLVRRTAAGDRLGGALLGLAAIARVTSGVVLIAMLAASPRPSWKRLILFAVPFLLGLGVLQWAMFGNPLTNGYDNWGVGFKETFSLHNIFGAATQREGLVFFHDHLTGGLMKHVACSCQAGGGGSAVALSNFWFYPAVLLGGFWVYGPPVLPLLALPFLWKHRREPVARFTVVLLVGSLVLFDTYLFQASRFMAGPASILIVLAAATVVEWGEALARRLRGTPPLATAEAAQVADAG